MEAIAAPTRPVTGRSTRRRVVRLLPAGMAVMVAVDVLLGDRAEYFNAAELVRAWGAVVTGDGLGGHHFIAGQASMADGVALLVGSAAFVLEPAVVLLVLTGGGAGLARVRRRSR